MKLGVVVTMCMLFGGTAVAAQNNRPVDSNECKEITARLIEGTNARFDRFSPSGSNVFFKEPDMVLSCTSHRLTGVSLNWGTSGFPPNAWFGLLAKAGRAVTGVNQKKLEAAIHKCHRAALKDEDELAELEILNAKVECQAFTRDGGAVNISIWINAHAQ